MLSETLRALVTLKDVRKKVGFVLLAIAIFRFAAHIPVPGVNSANLQEFFASNQVLGLLSLFSGGGIETFSIVALGIGPFITASIIAQLLSMIFPKLEELYKEPGGYAKINRWTRVATVPLAMIQGFSLLTLLARQSTLGIVDNLSGLQMLLAVVTLSAGTIFLMWLGELVGEYGIGNGISVIIFAGIVANLPGFISRFLSTYDSSQLFSVIIFALIVIVTIVAVVLLNEASRNIPVTYARHMRNGSMGGSVSNHLPLKVNSAGMIPIIFAVSLILFPSLIAQFTVQAKSEWLQNASQWVINVTQNKSIYAIAFFVCVFIFTYFYSSIVFRPDQIAKNLQDQGGFIPGIRPGDHTRDYLGYVANRILLTGALFLSTIAVLPNLIQIALPAANLTIAASSMLIVVSVVIDLVKQVETQVQMRNYEI